MQHVALNLARKLISLKQEKIGTFVEMSGALKDLGHAKFCNLNNGDWIKFRFSELTPFLDGKVNYCVQNGNNYGKIKVLSSGNYVALDSLAIQF